ncbi:aminotransferase class V-fold PLP-dependent enzyme [Pseudonocardia nigra]|uniref:aminotransferase class V-fold PLP-dependent enzyme n=1 Tax=Pseudonocardia nigra TaxID=1921578 RepID=UPI001C604F17|nr:aminotransferase class V-fold PLP-dependent enzyme [Pseudonocardia nigra]
MAFDVARVRGLIPVLGDGWIHLDAVSGMQIPEHVVSAITAALRVPRALPGEGFAASVYVAGVEAAARQSVADLVGGDPRGVVLGPGPAVLLRRLAESVGETWMLGDEIVVSRLDDTANVAPWVRTAHSRGAAVRWAEIEIESGELPTWQFDELVGDRTRLVTVTAASAHVGTQPDIAAIAERARAYGALLVVDLAVAAACGPVGIDGLGADVVVLDAAAWGGPQLGALVFRDPALLDRLPSCSLDPLARGSHRLELGPHPYPLLAGLVASIDHLAGLDDFATGTRRERLITSMDALEAHHSALLAELLGDLRRIGVSVLGAPEYRVPMLSLTHPVKAPDVADHLAHRGICTVADPAEDGVLAHLGTAEIGGAVRIGLAHYTSRAEIGALVAALSELG